ncbi:cytochrome c oxidase subunit II [Halorientalis marina]|jgi:cytochrome c oxidase subunit 2|uniref:cytochrome c oxidase subunit II n=1 Tax=Halorientalis marina TaxID=2931976 RepID=UPI001FF2FCD9|nr:cytochrome c oxidase subunit II [Halorientalis marina]
MEIHRFEKAWLGAGLLLIVGLIVTIVYGATGPGIAMVNDQGGQVDSTDIQNANYNATDGFESPGVRKVGENEYTVHVVAKQFLFEPGTNEPIQVPAGSEVTFYVTSADVVHGFQLVGTNVNTMVIPGQVAEFTTRFEETGEHGIVCHEYCGAAHHTMAGTIEVVPQSEFNESTLEGT